MVIFDGAAHAAHLDSIIKSEISKKGIPGELLIVMIGDNPASAKYVGVKSRLCERLGIPVHVEKITDSSEDGEILATVERLFSEARFSGGIVQLPLPRPSLEVIFDRLPPQKDIDILSGNNLDRNRLGDYNYMNPVLRSAIYFLNFASGINTPEVNKNESVNCLVQQYKKLTGCLIGHGRMVGAPIAWFLDANKLPYCVEHKYRKGHKIYSDYTIIGVGKPNLVHGDDLQNGSSVLDFGTTVVEGKIVGDLNKNSECGHLGVVSFSPGGIGSVVVRFLLMNYLGI